MENRTMSQKVEIVKQVKLSPNQRIALITAANNKGVFEHIDSSTRETLRYLGLIEQLPRYAAERLKEQETKVVTAWKELSAAAKRKSIKGVEEHLRTITADAWHRNDKIWVLSKDAKDYLENGKVTITVGKAAFDGK